MTGCLVVPLLLTAVIGSFWWLWTPWIIMGALGAFILFTFIGVLQVKAPAFTPELSTKANDLHRMYAGFFRFPSALREFSGTASGIQLSAAVIAVVHGYYHSWWFLGLGALFYLIFAPIAVKMNPSYFLKTEEDKEAFREVIDYIKRRQSEHLSAQTGPGKASD